MGRLIFWILALIAAAFMVRRWRARRDSAPNLVAELRSVRCHRCGVFIPQKDALLVEDRYHCPSCSCGEPKTP